MGFEKRSSAASSIWPGHGLRVTGGINGKDFRISSREYLSSTEYLSDSTDQWTPGPVLPVGIYDHCQVTAGPDVIITGGFDGNSIMVLPVLTRYPLMAVAGPHSLTWPLVGLNMPVWSIKTTCMS